MEIKIWTIPNIISIIRIIFVPIFILFYLTNHIQSALIIFVISAISDFLDGYIARHFNQISPLGRILDPLADRFFIVLVLLVSFYRPIVPAILAALILLREVIVGLFQMFLAYKGFKTTSVYFLGKLSTAMIYFSIPIILLAELVEFETLIPINFGITFLSIATFLYWFIGIFYIANSIKTFKKHNVKISL